MSNALSGSASVYLRSHADSPIDWRRWSVETLEEAKAAQKPLFISIGYYSCHWCHVMTRESFYNTEIAAILNRSYIPVLIDREESPEADAFYRSACTLFHGFAAWPLNIIAAPDGSPFFASSYLPRENMGTSAGLTTLLPALAEKWSKDRKELLRVAAETASALYHKPAVRGKTADGDFLQAAFEQLAASFDEEYGGFGQGAKYPAAHQLLFLLRYSALSGNKRAREIADKTLQQMYRGGIYDHFGGGFCRGTVDREWLRPFFEKTLSDNALLAYTYTEAWQNGRFGLYRTVAENTLDYLLRELKLDCGGFSVSQDSDSDGMEGAYYLFTPAEVRKVLGEDDGRHFCECYDITEEGTIKGRSIPNLLLNNRWGLLPEGYEDFREQLRMFREERCTLYRDAVVTSVSNGLTLMALAKAAAVFSDPRYLSEARALADFILRTLVLPDGSVLHGFCGNRSMGPGTLEDSAFLALGLLELYSACYEPAYLSAAVSLARQIPHHFSSPYGGYYDGESSFLPVRPQTLTDTALPSGNSAAAYLFRKLQLLTGDSGFRSLYAEQSALLSACCGNYPAGCCFGLCASLSEVFGYRTLLCTSPEKDPSALLSALRSQYAPELHVLLKTPDRSPDAVCGWTSGCEISTQNGVYLYREDGEPLKLS